MTNREVFKAPKEVLNAIDRQRQFLLRVELTPIPCPACKRPLDAITAAGLDVDDYDFGKTPLSFKCPHCQAELEQVVPFVASGPGWFWQLKDNWLQEQLRKAKMLDQMNEQQPEGS